MLNKCVVEKRYHLYVSNIFVICAIFTLSSPYFYDFYSDSSEILWYWKLAMWHLYKVHQCLFFWQFFLSQNWEFKKNQIYNVSLIFPLVLRGKFSTFYSTNWKKILFAIGENNKVNMFFTFAFCFFYGSLWLVFFSCFSIHDIVYTNRIEEQKGWCSWRFFKKFTTKQNIVGNLKVLKWKHEHFF